MPEDKKFEIPKLPEAPKIPDIKIPDINLKKSIKSGVDKANAALSTLESHKIQASHFASSRMIPLFKQAKMVFTRAVQTYETRRHYGPQIVLGTAASVGFLAALRRGKIQGTFLGGLSGAGAYKLVYGNDGGKWL